MNENISIHDIYLTTTKGNNELTENLKKKKKK